MANRHPDALATLASKIKMEGNEAQIIVVNQAAPVTLLPYFEPAPVTDWLAPIIKQLETKEGSLSLSDLSKYFLLQGELYRKNPSGYLSRCIGPDEAKGKLEAMHGKTCGASDIPLYRRVQREGYFWPDMARDASQVQQGCPHCQSFPTFKEACLVEVNEDWRVPYINYLVKGTLPGDKDDALAIKKRAFR